MPRRDLSEELEEALGRALGSWNYCLTSDHHHDLGVAQLDVHLAIVASYPARASERASYLLSNESSRAQRARHRIPKLMEMSRKSKNLRPSTRWSCSRHWSMKRRSLVDSGASFIELVCLCGVAVAVVGQQHKNSSVRSPTHISLSLSLMLHHLLLAWWSSTTRCRW